MNAATTVFAARRIVTMDPSRPEATHVAVRDGLVLGAGTIESLRGWGAFELDERFADKVLLPGFVEGHVHMTEGMSWRHVYCGFHDRTDPDGRRWPGAKSLEAVQQRLREALATRAGDGLPLVGWGFDPIYFPGARRCVREDLDAVTTARPVLLLHSNGHLITASTSALAVADYLRPGIDHPGVPLGADGLPTGELKGPEAMTPVLQKHGVDRYEGDEAAALAFSKLCVRAGVTTATDLVNPLPEAAVEMLLRVTAAADFPTRIVPAMRGNGLPVAELVERALALRGRSTDRLRLGAIKVVADGSIQGFSARLKAPGYFNGAPQGLWYVAPEWLQQMYDAALAGGVQIHTHTNGDQATELALDAIERALARHPQRDHRFVLQHCQLASDAQFRRMKALGLCANLFANHLYYWGDAHRELTVGPDRAERMNACRTAIETGVPFSIHSDAPVTPMGPLFTAWCAVNRLTSSGRCLGEHQRIGVMDALRAVTLGAAYTLRLDGEVGSIETGKRADFAVLDDDPLELPAHRLHEARVWGVVQGGRVFPAPGA
jgi:predicted amidohydrolase YtcJ